MQIKTDSFQKEVKNHGNEQFPFLISHEQISTYDLGSFLCHWHPEIELTYVISGQMMYQINLQTYHLRQGNILWGNVNTLHNGFMVEQQDCEYISITFDPKLIYGYSNSILFHKYVGPFTNNLSLSAIYMDGLADWHQSIIHSIHQMVDLASTKIDGYEFDIVHCLQTIWRQLYSNVSFDTAMRKDHENNERIKAILHYIHLHYSDDITLSDIANCIHLSPSECSRMFTNYMHTHLFTYLQRYRIEKSLDYLSNSNDSITEIASRVGFPDSNYYSKIFAKYKKCSPRAYRKHLAN